MVTLVLCIDRDDDLGRKTGRVSPIIGRSANLEAAVALGLADPGESDTNTIFEALRTYDRLLAEGHQVEVATLCGDIRVGDRSDMKIAKQLDQVIKATKATEAVLITDGSEDAYITPIVSSRMKINATTIVYIKQARNLESTYYTIRAMLEDPKIQRTLLYPVMLMGLVSLMQFFNGSYAWGTVLMAMTLLFMIRYFKLEEALVTFINDTFTGVASRVTFLTGILALFLIIAGLIWGLDAATKVESEYSITPLLVFVSTQGVLLWILVAVWVWEFGRVVDHYLNEGAFKASFLKFTCMLAAVGFVVSGAVGLMRYAVRQEIEPMGIFLDFIYGIVAAVIGWALMNYLRNQQNGEELASVGDWQQ